MHGLTSYYFSFEAELCKDERALVAYIDVSDGGLNWKETL